MREIKFRGKRKDNGEWIEGYILRYSPIFEELTYILPIPSVCVNDVEVDPSIICQYTGLKDENGKEIYEGDIVGFIDCTSTESGYWEQDCAGEVKWSKEEAMFYVTNRLMAESYEVLQDCEVIGNIFDNPELLGSDCE